MADNPRIEELRRRVQSDPASIAFAALAEEYRRTGRHQEAIDICRTGLQRHPAYLSARVTLGRALIEVGDFESARIELETVLASAPENLAAIRGLAQIHERLGHSVEMHPDLAALAAQPMPVKPTVVRIEQPNAATPDVEPPAVTTPELTGPAYTSTPETPPALTGQAYTSTPYVSTSDTSTPAEAVSQPLAIDLPDGAGGHTDLEIGLPSMFAVHRTIDIDLPIAGDPREAFTIDLPPAPDLDAAVTNPEPPPATAAVQFSTSSPSIETPVATDTETAPAMATAPDTDAETDADADTDMDTDTDTDTGRVLHGLEQFLAAVQHARGASASASASAGSSQGGH